MKKHINDMTRRFKGLGKYAVVTGFIAAGLMIPKIPKHEDINVCPLRREAVKSFYVDAGEIGTLENLSQKAFYINGKIFKNGNFSAVDFIDSSGRSVRPYENGWVSFGMPEDGKAFVINEVDGNYRISVWNKAQK